MKKESNFKKLMDLALSHKYFAYLSCVFASVSAIFSLMPYYFIWKIIKELLEGKNLNVVYNGWMAVLFSFISMILYIASLFFSHNVAFRVQKNMKIKMIDHILKLPIGEVMNYGSGKIRKIVNDSASETETYLAHNMPDKVVSFITPLGLLIMMMTFDYRLGLISLIPALLAFLIMFSFMNGKKLKNDMKNYQDSLLNMSNEAVEYVRGMNVVKTFGQSIDSFNRFKDSINEYEKWTTSYTKKMMWPMVLFTTSSNSIFAFIIIAGYTLEKNITNAFLLNIIFYILITSILTVTLMKLAYAGESNMLLIDSIERMNMILNMKPLEMTKNPVSPKNYGIDLKDVSFSYDGKTDVLSNITLNIKEGSHVAFIGQSGGGKTTIASLIARFFDPSKGAISIGNVNIKDIDYNELMDSIAYVFQDSKLLKMSILDNVKMSKKDASIEEVMDALEKAQCMDIIEKLPDGINTMIGSEGVYLSGGECQRIAIARALLKDAKIIILDEATAFSDPLNEVLIEKAFNNLAKNKTVIMIAHRLSTITNADYIYVIEKGTILESGTYQELTENQGRFYDMVNKYNTKINWKVGRNND